jgi:ATP-dependent Clp protease adaptor protein ClpS
VDAVIYLVTAAGLGVMWWRLIRPPRGPRVAPFDEAAEIALHVAGHEAAARSQHLEAAHVLHGLLQEESFAGAVPRLGLDVDAIERRMFSLLDSLPKAGRGAGEPTPACLAAIGRALALARSAERSARPADLLASVLRDGPLVDELLAPLGARGLDLLFVLAHGFPERELRIPDAPELGVVIVNDDFTPMELVVEVLVKDLGLDPARAHDLMLRVHLGGRELVGRYAASDARARVRQATARVRGQGSPLLLRLE